MKLYKTSSGNIIETKNQYFGIDEDWDTLINRDGLLEYLQAHCSNADPLPDSWTIPDRKLEPPVGSQEIWASGVTYYNSREARMDESRDSGGGDFYDRVYNAERPELFLKATPYRAVGSGQNVRIRRDSGWNVPEPELTLVINSKKEIVGYTIGNDMSSRDIEGENPLYLPQAKCYDGSAAVGPCIYITDKPLGGNTRIHIEITRGNELVFEEAVEVKMIKRKFEELVHYLFLEYSFPSGALLMTGTGIVPPNDFTLQKGDEIKITIDKIGTLINNVA
ncbi:MAG: fumarylacetoacetate hydrolase family protein [Cyclobacteriaceae bacterium]